MSTPVNYYLGLQRGVSQLKGTGSVAVATSTAGTSADVEVRLQIDNGTGKTGLTKLDVKLMLEMILHYLEGDGVAGGAQGTDLPAL